MRLIIDTDPAMGTIGGDPEDCFAVLLALNSPGVTVEGITVVQGNVPAEKGYSNVKHLLELVGRTDVPVRRGLVRPLSQDRPIQVGFLERRYAMSQLTEMIEPPDDEAGAVDFLVEKVQQNPGEITIVTIGPCTNLAKALQTAPDLAGKVRGIVMMGGTAAVAGNISPAAEFNFWQDPEAADIVFRSGAPLTMVGLDVCHQTELHPRQVEDVAGESELGRFVLEATKPWFRVMGGGTGDGALHLYDSLAMAVAIDPTLVALEDSFVEIETSDGPAQGMSVSHHVPFQRILFRHQETNAKVALEVDVERFYAVFQERVLDVIAKGRKNEQEREN
ncbi:MAG: nucleoside hydrolase [Acidobacteriota bacterium]